MPAGGMLTSPPQRPPSRAPDLPFPAPPPDVPARPYGPALQRANDLLGKVATDERRKEASQAWGKVTSEAGKLATPERQQKVMLGVAKLGSKAGEMFGEARKKLDSQK